MGSISSFLESTFLIERLTGVGIYVLALGFFYYQISHSGSLKRINRYLNWYVVLLGIMAFFYIPGASADLTRWRVYANSWTQMSFSTFLTQRAIPSQTPAAYLLMYLCQKTGIDGLLPCVCALAFYSNCFLSLKIVAEKYNLRSRSIAISLLFLMAPGMFLEVISGVRCFLSFSFICRCICDECLDDKSLWKNIIWYVLACLLHTAAMALVALRLLVLLFEEKRGISIRVLNVIAVMVMAFLAFRYGNNLMDATLAKAASYTTNTIYQYSWEYLIGGIGFIMICLVAYPAFKKRAGGYS